MESRCDQQTILNYCSYTRYCKVHKPLPRSQAVHQTQRRRRWIFFFFTTLPLKTPLYGETKLVSFPVSKRTGILCPLVTQTKKRKWWNISNEPTVSVLSKAIHKVKNSPTVWKSARHTCRHSNALSLPCPHRIRQQNLDQGPPEALRKTSSHKQQEPQRS